MSIMRCDFCERSVDTDYEVGEYFDEQKVWLCDRCICDSEAFLEMGLPLPDEMKETK